MSLPQSSAPKAVINRIQFSLMSPQEIRSLSVCEVTTEELTDSGMPKEGGLLDPRMGPIERGNRCTTCHGSYDDCPGHFGHIELAEPLYHPGYMQTILSVLNCVCHACSRLLLPKDEPKYARLFQIRNSRARLGAIRHECTNRQCGRTTSAPADQQQPSGLGGVLDVPRHFGPKFEGCGSSQPKFRVLGLDFEIEWNEKEDAEDTKSTIHREEKKRKLKRQEVYDILRRITDEDSRILGFDPLFSRPEWMLVTVLPVPPPPVRPSVMMDSSTHAEDDLTHKLNDIIKANKKVREGLEKGVQYVALSSIVELLQYHYSTYIDNSIPGFQQSIQTTGKPIKSITQRLKGKEGRIRGNLMGKRVDFSGRTVITPDPNLSCDQVGVPRSIANTLTFPEVVTHLNIQKMYEYVRRGPNEHPGARYIIDTSGQRFDLTACANPAQQHLEVGYIVERHMIDGDYVIFNRQPSLHKMSMMGHRVKILPYSSFRLNLSCTTPYNADFDGDEMNLHLPQSQEARAEVREIMMVPKQIISPQKNGPVIGIVQDTLLASMFFTRRDCFLERDLMMNCLMWLTDWNGIVPRPAILKPRPLWTGKQIFSLMIPTISITKKTSMFDDDEKELVMTPNDSMFIINKGQHFSGQTCKKTLGRDQQSLIHIIWKDFGPEAAKYFINQIQRVVNYWLIHTGFTVGISDTIATDSTVHEVGQILQEAQREVEGIVQKLQEKNLDREPGKSIIESFEARVNTTLNNATNKAGSVVMKLMTTKNNIYSMVVSGSKGGKTNISQILGCVGQQNVEGKRIRYGFKRRTLPYFTKDNLGLESKGFVQNSFLRGLTPTEFFFHAMGGREGIIDTACKTSDTGYIQRQLVKAMEDLNVKYDTTIRNSAGSIIQFCYGEDGMAGEQMESQTFPTMIISDDEMLEDYYFNLAELFNMNNSDMDEKIAGKEEEFGLDVELDAAALFDDGMMKEPESAVISQQSRKALPQRVLPTGVRTLATFLTAEALDSLKHDPNSQTILNQEFQTLQADRELLRNEIFKNGNDSVAMPVNVNRIITNAKYKFDVSRYRPTSLLPTEVVRKVSNLISSLVIIPGKDKLSRQAQENALTLFSILLRSLLASRIVTEKHHLTREAFDWALEEIKNKFEQARIQPGESIGVIAAQSMSEPATQMTLNTFHYAGVSAKNVTLGVPRLKELIHLAKNPKTPSLTIYLKEEHRKNEKGAKSIQSILEYTTLRRIVDRTEIWYDPNDADSVIEEDRSFLEDHVGLSVDEMQREKSPWILRIVLNKQMMADKHLRVPGVSKKIMDVYGNDLESIPSNDNADDIVIRLRPYLTEEEISAGEEKMASSDQTDFLRSLEQSLLDNIALIGIPGISRVFLREIETIFKQKDGSMKKEKEWTLETEGVNLQEILRYPEIDFARTVSNTLTEIQKVLGIEAVRNMLLKELRYVLGFDGTYVNYRHYAILIDLMTSQGEPMSISRQGINKQNTGPLMRATFEESTKILLEAAAFSEMDNMQGVSQAVIVGQVPPCGTGVVDVTLDFNKIAKANYVPDIVQAMTMQNIDASTQMRAALSEDGGADFLSATSPYSPDMMGSYNAPYSFSPVRTEAASLPPVGAVSPQARQLTRHRRPRIPRRRQRTHPLHQHTRRRLLLTPQRRLPTLQPRLPTHQRLLPILLPVPLTPPRRQHTRQPHPPILPLLLLIPQRHQLILRLHQPTHQHHLPTPPPRLRIHQQVLLTRQLHQLIHQHRQHILPQVLRIHQQAQPIHQLVKND
ncbi:putative DNA-directed RNA polymerase II subunit RPB1 [Blattamonas nauphoetae]|uniref:DNA-directed RNA polymerase subunit n=1 Tax=Blattamonas nauphoetae TaxID=2049346 RepID=A0ABQ9YKZ2_9EUKA|nr:putative DNA-directed RNA polymerase II subunit RPB1 [Blattamonas nauphoetae]